MMFDKYKYSFIGGFFGLMLITIAIQSYRINSYKAKLAESTAQVTILSASIETSNEAVEKLSEDSLKRTQEASEALKKAESISLHRRSKIMKLQSQLNNGDSCDSAIESVKAAL